MTKRHPLDIEFVYGPKRPKFKKPGRRPKARVCPFCGSADVIVGVDSAASRSAQCRSCRAKIVREFPAEYMPKGWTLEDCDRYTEHIVVALWNRRTS